MLNSILVFIYLKEQHTILKLSLFNICRIDMAYNNLLLYST